MIEEAVIAARENAARNGVRNCRFIAGDVLKVLDEIEERPDIIILDPPREGVNPKALRKLIRYGVPRIIYVSCKPSSLVTDLEILREGGYHTTRAAGVDMFPRTPGVEAVLLLERREPASDQESTACGADHTAEIRGYDGWNHSICLAYSPGGRTWRRKAEQSRQWSACARWKTY